VNPFVDSVAFKTFIEQAEQKFLVQFRREREGVAERKELGN